MLGIGLGLTQRAGQGVRGGPLIVLSSATVADTATVGATVGTLSVAGGSGTYTFTLTSNPGTLFAISGASLNVAAALSAGSDAITVHADNGAGSVLNRALIITVTHAGGTVALGMDMSDFRNTYILGL
jgi:hypothetical protein